MDFINCKQCDRSVFFKHYGAAKQKRIISSGLCAACRGKNYLNRIMGKPVVPAKEVPAVLTPRGEKVLEESKITDNTDPDVLANDTLEKTFADLDSLVGMAKVKESVRALVSFLEIMKEREKHGITNEPISLHVVFRGPPGTGKTTVARILGRVYRHLGYLKVGTTEETDRSGLVGEYVGHTAVKTHKLVDKCMDRVLFIDEAYSLSAGGSSSNDFGAEAIAALVKRMEDNRDRLAVIVAGYSADMERFLAANAGLRSRFNTFFDFDNYVPDELFTIFANLCKKQFYTMNEDTEACAKKLLEKLFNERDDATFGNGRLVRNIMEMAVKKHAARVYKIEKRTKHTLMHFIPEDLPTIDEVNLSQAKEKKSEMNADM